ncbi:hypothetical protein ACWDTT_15750 [Streptosporangium sandarakinum]
MSSPQQEHRDAAKDSLKSAWENGQTETTNLLLDAIAHGLLALTASTVPTGFDLGLDKPTGRSAADERQEAARARVREFLQVRKGVVQAAALALDPEIVYAVGTTGGPVRLMVSDLETLVGEDDK